MASLILEIRRKHSDRVEFQRIQSLPARIGRGYDNDLILDDPYISPRHALLNTSEDGLLIEDCDSENGIKLGDGTARIQESATLEPGDLFTLGDTQIRILTPEMEVEPTRIQHNIAWYLVALTHPVSAWLLCLLVCLAAALSAYLQSASEIEFKEFSITITMILFVQLLWAGGWAFAGRTLKKRPSFHRQLTVFAGYMLISIPLTLFTEYLEYLTSSLLIGKIFSYLLALSAFATALYLSLWIASAMHRQRRLIVAGLVSALFGLIALAINMGASSPFDSRASYSTMLKPPFAPTFPAISMDSFLAESSQMIESIALGED